MLLEQHGSALGKEGESESTLALVEEDWMEVRFAGLPDREP